MWNAAMLPTFHTMAFLNQLLPPLANGTPCALFTPQAPKPPIVPTPQNVLEVTKVTGSDAFLLIPAFLEVSFLSYLEYHSLTGYHIDHGPVAGGD